MQNLIIGNFGNHSLAVMQALIEQNLPELHFIYVETGWAADCWPSRVLACSDYARKQGVQVHELKPQATFSEMVIDRRQFPCPKFQWCASFLKGLTLINYLEQLDPFCESLIISGKRQRDSRRYANLQEFEEESEFYQGRTLWHPLWNFPDREFLGLIERTGLEVLTHPSLECSPCIHTKGTELGGVEPQVLARVAALEQEIGQTMYAKPINLLESKSELLVRDERIGLQQFDRGCGAPWNCGE